MRPTSARTRASADRRPDQVEALPQKPASGYAPSAPPEPALDTAARYRISAAIIALCGGAIIVVGRDASRIVGVVLLCVSATFLAVAARRRRTGGGATSDAAPKGSSEPPR